MDPEQVTSSSGGATCTFLLGWSFPILLVSCTIARQTLSQNVMVGHAMILRHLSLQGTSLSTLRATDPLLVSCSLHAEVPN